MINYSKLYTENVRKTNIVFQVLECFPGELQKL